MHRGERIRQAVHVCVPQSRDGIRTFAIDAASGSDTERTIGHDVTTRDDG